MEHEVVSEERAAEILTEHDRKHFGCDGYARPQVGNWGIFLGCSTCKDFKTVAVDNDAYRSARKDFEREGVAVF